MESSNSSTKVARFLEAIHWHFPGERVLYIIDNVMVFVPSLHTFVQGSVYITTFRLEFIWLEYSDRIDKKNDSRTFLKSFSIHSFGRLKAHVYFVPYFSIWKVEDKKGFVNGQSACEVIFRGKTVQFFHIREIPIETTFYEVTENNRIEEFNVCRDLTSSMSISTPAFLHKIQVIQRNLENYEKCFAFTLKQFLKVNEEDEFIVSKKFPMLELHTPDFDIIYGHSSHRILGFPTFTHKEIEAGYNVYDPEEEFRRQGAIGGGNARWRISEANKEYKLCSTYPKIICVPKETDDATLKKCADFRSKGRLPVLTWRNKRNGVPIARSAQPLTGIAFGRNIEDETVIAHIRNANNSGRLVFVDARPKANAYGNALVGKGFENTSNYESTSIEFVGIPNIHGVSSSLKDAICVFSKTDQDFSLTSFEGTNWMKYTSTLFRGVHRIIDLVENQKTPVLVRCSDGWDRTSQLTSLSTLCMDPYYRTIKGFQVLIEKDWISFGHKFGDRSGFTSDTEMSPIFFQFLDCVYQLWKQYPSEFEFNILFLRILSEHCYSGLFGNFLANCESDIRNRIQNTTISIWTYINHDSILPHMKNPLYIPKQEVIIPKYETIILMRNFWWSHFLHHESEEEMLTRNLLKEKEKRIEELENKYREVTTSDTICNNSSHEISLVNNTAPRMIIHSDEGQEVKVSIDFVENFDFHSLSSDQRGN